jgi:hypothetical protein
MGMGCDRNHSRKSNASLLAPFIFSYVRRYIYIYVYPQLDQQIYSALVFYMLTDGTWCHCQRFNKNASAASVRPQKKMM